MQNEFSKIEKLLEEILVEIKKVSGNLKNNTLSSVISPEAEEKLYKQAIKLITEHESVSATLLQRKFRIGYASSARLLDKLEKGKFIGPANGAKPRKVLKK